MAKIKRVKATTNNLTNAVKAYVKSKGYFCFRVNVQGIPLSTGGWRKSGAEEGVSDLIAVVRGNFVGIEIKNKHTNDKMREKQETFRDNVLSSGGVYIVAETYSQFTETFDYILNFLMASPKPSFPYVKP